MTKRIWLLSMMATMGACGGVARHADEPTLAAQAQPYRPTQAGHYRFEAQSSVPVSLRLFSMTPDLYLETGRTEGGTARIDSTLDPDTTYAITMAGTECRPAHVSISVARAE